jgi:hypothetical protein
VSFFDEIDAVPWANLHHAYGPATDVPDLLKALMTPEAASSELREAAKRNKRSVFDEVTWVLWGNVYHQGSVWQVTATTVPFLAAILRDGPDDPETKAFLITYLHHLALGYPEDMFPDIPNPDEAFAAVTGLQEPGGEPEYGADDNRYLIWVRDSYEAVEQHIDFVLPYLEAEDDDVADAAIALCGSLPRCAEETVPPLRQLASSGGRRGAVAAVSLAVLTGTDARPLAEAIAAAPDRLTAVLGACAAVLSDAAGLSTDIIATLTQPLDALAEAQSAHASTLSTLVGRCLERLGADHRDRAVAAVCTQLATANPSESVSLTHSLLALAFRAEPPPEHASALSATQRCAIEAIRDHGAFKIADSTFSNYAMLLEDWGLPRTADGIDTWLRAD